MAGEKDTPRSTAEEVTYREGDLPSFGLPRAYCTAAASGVARWTHCRRSTGNRLFCTGVRRWSSPPMGFAAMHL